MSVSDFNAGVERWAALRTAARWEKKLAGQLALAGVPVFLPLMTKLTDHNGKRRSSEVPIFGGYVFCSESEFLTSKALTRGTRAKVAQVLRPPNPDLLRDELRQLANLLVDRRLVQERLVGRVGEVVRITSGSLVGYQGAIIRVQPNRWQVVLAVSFLGVRVHVEVDERLVQRTS